MSEDPQKVDLREKYPEIFKQLPILNQGSFGTCYLYSAYTALEFIRKKEALTKNPKDVSKASLAHLGLLTSTGGTQISGGHSFTVFNAVKNHPWVCDSKAIPTEYDKVLFSYLDSVKITEFYRELFSKAFIAGKFELSRLNSIDYAKLYKTYDENRKRNASLDSYSQKLLSPLSEKEFLNLIKNSVENHSFLEGFLKTPMIERMDQSCPANAQLKIPNLKVTVMTVKSDNKRDALTKLWNAFSSPEPFPVPVAGCLSGLEHGMCEAGKDDNHAMVILGRRNNFGGKEFLIRNSWGKVNTGLPDPNAFGEAWVSDSLLYGFLNEITFLSK